MLMVERKDEMKVAMLGDCSVVQMVENLAEMTVVLSAVTKECLRVAH